MFLTSVYPRHRRGGHRAGADPSRSSWLAGACGTCRARRRTRSPRCRRWRPRRWAPPRPSSRSRRSPSNRGNMANEPRKATRPKPPGWWRAPSSSVSSCSSLPAALVVLVWWGAKAVIDGQVTGGQFAQFMIYAFMASNALSSLSELAGTVQSVTGATERLVEILDTQSSLSQPAEPLPFPARRSGCWPSSMSISAMSPARARQCCTMSASPCGGPRRWRWSARRAPASRRSSPWCSGFYDVTAGAVRVDGLDVREVDQAALRRHFAYVEQEPTIFAGTIAENIRFGRPDATPCRGAGGGQGGAGRRFRRHPRPGL